MVSGFSFAKETTYIGILNISTPDKFFAQSKAIIRFALIVLSLRDELKLKGRSLVRVVAKEEVQTACCFPTPSRQRFLTPSLHSFETGQYLRFALPVGCECSASKAPVTNGTSGNVLTLRLQGHPSSSYLSIVRNHIVPGNRAVWLLTLRDGLLSRGLSRFSYCFFPPVWPLEHTILMFCE